VKCRLVGDTRHAPALIPENETHSSHLTFIFHIIMRIAEHLQHAHELMKAHPLIDSHVDLPYVMRAVRESEPVQVELTVKIEDQ
jgi:hypothetical protein